MVPPEGFEPSISTLKAAPEPLSQDFPASLDLHETRAPRGFSRARPGRAPSHDPTSFRAVFVGGARPVHETCEAAGVAPISEEWTKGGDPIRVVLSLNEKRRHLTPAQRTDIAERIATLRTGDVASQRADGSPKGEAPTFPTFRASRVEAAKLMKIGTVPGTVNGRSRTRTDIAERIATLRVGNPEFGAISPKGEAPTFPTFRASRVEAAELMKIGTVPGTVNGRSRTRTDIAERIATLRSGSNRFEKKIAPPKGEPTNTPPTFRASRVEMAKESASGGGGAGSNDADGRNDPQPTAPIDFA
jgi:hypothetical protein